MYNKILLFVVFVVIVGLLVYFHSRKVSLYYELTMGMENIYSLNPISKPNPQLAYFNPCITSVNGVEYVFYREAMGLCNDLSNRLYPSEESGMYFTYLDNPGDLIKVIVAPVDHLGLEAEERVENLQFEDLRVIEYNGNVYGICNGYQKSNNSNRMVLLNMGRSDRFPELSGEGEKVLMTYPVFMKYRKAGHREKNWVPFVHPKHGLCLIYDISKRIILRVDIDSEVSRASHGKPWNFSASGRKVSGECKEVFGPYQKEGLSIRGGSQGVVLDGKVYGIGHTMSGGGEYANVLYSIDLETGDLRYSKEFMFGHHPNKYIQFSSGLIITPTITKISFGVMDCTSHLVVVDTTQLMGLM